jgi:hypothetical protein
MPLSGSCERAKRSINVLANYNAAFLRAPAQATYCDGSSLKKGAALKLGFPGHRSATCVEEKRNGEILVTVTTQAWRWPDARAEGDADMQETAWINYDAYLTTTRATLHQNLETFRAVLQKVRIQRPE